MIFSNKLRSKLDSIMKYLDGDRVRYELIIEYLEEDRRYLFKRLMNTEDITKFRLCKNLKKNRFTMWGGRDEKDKFEDIIFKDWINMMLRED